MQLIRVHSLGLGALIDTLRVLGPALGTEPFALRRHHNAHALEVEPLDQTVVPVACDHLGDLVVRTTTVAVHGFSFTSETRSRRRSNGIPYVVRLEVLQCGESGIG